MPYLPTAQAFLEQSTLLLSARPTTARITTKYNIPHPSPPPNRFRPTSSRPDPPREKSDTETPDAPAKTSTQDAKKQASLTLRCYDPTSGTCLKYRTDKAAEVGRLVAALGGCARVMAGLPPKKEEEGVKEDVKEETKVKVEDGMVVDSGEAGTGDAKAKIKKEDGEDVKEMKGKGQAQGPAKGGDSGGGGGGKKKKKGKR